MDAEQRNPWFLLIVEDSESILTLLAKIGGMIPHLDVGKTYSAESALEIARSRKPDLVISDLGLPGKDGQWLLEQLHREDISCPFIVLTACHDSARIIDLYRAGAIRYLLKPSPVSEIYQAIIELLPPPVEFEFNTQPGSRVYVAGDFNNWNAQQYQLLENPEPGHYKCRIPLSRGRHEYKFIVNDQWQCDPNRPLKAFTEQGYENSVIEVASESHSPLETGMLLS